jgi:hypothetical protein
VMMMMMMMMMSGLLDASACNITSIAPAVIKKTSTN